MRCDTLHECSRIDRRGGGRFAFPILLAKGERPLSTAANVRSACGFQLAQQGRYVGGGFAFLWD
jgi:hypothetical protein